MTRMAHFRASSYAVSPAAEEGGEFWDEVVGGIHVGSEREL